MIGKQENPDVGLDQYYERVGEFYDQTSANFEDLYWSNSTLQRMRQAFREEVKKFNFDSILEIGSGPGIDVVHFSAIFPDKVVCAIEISEGMLHYSYTKLSENQIKNAFIHKGSVEDLKTLFKDKKFDLVYVFFGALNTVKDLELAFQQISDSLERDGKAVLTFVNKYYIAEVLISLLKLDLKRAFARFKKVWHGYSNRWKVESRCYSPREIKIASGGLFEVLDRKGYSIVYPAWYRDKWVRKFGKKVSNLLWNLDHFLNRTFLWKFGEYTLFVMRKVQ